jgi:hypothetical protein
MRVVTARSDGDVVEALIEEAWTPIPYTLREDRLWYTPGLLATLNLTADPLGSPVPPAGWTGLFSLTPR